MSLSSTQRVAKTYSHTGIYSGVDSADPHRLIDMLLNGLLDRLAAAKGHMLRKEIAAKGLMIGKAIALLGGLRASLDNTAGGELAQNLDQLYEYMQSQLVLANAANDATILDHVAELLARIKSAWTLIPSELHKRPALQKSVS